MLKLLYTILFIIMPASTQFKEIAKAVQDMIDIHITGAAFKTSFNQVKELQSTRDFTILKEVSTPQTPGIFAQFRNQYSKVFRADGYVRNIQFKDADSKLIEDAEAYLEVCWDGNSIRNFMSDDWCRSNDESPNDVIVLELPKEPSDLPEPFPVTYSWTQIHEIQCSATGITLLVLKIPKKQGDKEQKYRLIDKNVDQVVRIDQAGNYVPVMLATEEGEIIPDNIFHNLGYVPAILCGQHKVTRDKNSAVTNQYHWGLLQATKYQSLCNDHDLTVKHHAYPLLYAYRSNCGTCRGKGTVILPNHDEETNCDKCHGEGSVPFAASNPAEGVEIPLPIDIGFDKPVPKIEPPVGYADRPIDLITKQQELKKDWRKEIEVAVMGMQENLERVTGVTATENLLDYQPKEDRFNSFSDKAQYVEEFLTYAILDMRYNTTLQSDAGDRIVRFEDVDIHYGRKYNLRTYEEILLAFELKKKAGTPVFILEAELKESIEAKWEHDPTQRARGLYLIDIEPFPTYSVEEIVNLKLATDRDIKVKQYFDTWVAQIEEEKFKPITTFEPKEAKLLLTEIYNIVFNVSDESKDSETAKAQSNLRGTVGGVQGIIEINRAIKEGVMSPEAGKVILVEVYGFDTVIAGNVIKVPKTNIIKQNNNTNANETGENAFGNEG